MPFISAYKYSKNEKVFYLRRDNVDENNIPRECFGRIISLDDMEETPYCYEAEFHVPLEEDAFSIERRFLHQKQIALVSDSRKWREHQIVVIEGAHEMSDESSNFALISRVSSEGWRIRVLTPNRGQWGYLDSGFIEEFVSPLLPEDVDNILKDIGHPDYNHLRSFLKHMAVLVGFVPIEYVNCLNCNSWIDPGYNQYIDEEGYLCEPCVYEYEYKCDLCDQMRRYNDNIFQYLTRPDNGKKVKVCSHCYDVRVFKCNMCSTKFLDEQSDLFDGRRYCFKCFEKRAADVFISPPRALSRASISKLLLPDDKIYALNKSKTPVAIEIEVVNEGAYEDEEDGEYHFDESGYPRGWTDVHDGSLNEGGREFIMQPEVGDAALSTVTEFCSWAISKEFYADASCGLHVHTDAYYLGIRELKGIMLTMMALEPFIYQMLPSHRREIRYSAPMSENVKAEDILSIKSIRDFCHIWYEVMNETSASQDKYNDSRYRGLNMHSKMLHGTIEYRYHHGTLNSENISNWMILCLTISDFGAKLLSPDTETKLLDLFILKESKDFSDYLQAMGADNLIPYVKNMLEEHDYIPSDSNSGDPIASSGGWTSVQQQ